jgi:hypothetical protein
MEALQHDEQLEIEEAALDAGYGDTDLEPVQPTVEDQPQGEQQEETTPEEVEKPLTRAEFQAMADRAASLEAQLTKVHDKAFGKIGELQQRIEQIRTAGTGLSPKAKERLSEEFPELAEMLFDGAGEVAPPVATPDFDQIVESKVLSRQEKLQQDLERRLLTRDHRDWEQVVQADDFKGWVTNLPADEQTRLSTSWDADFISEKLTEFKSWKSERNKTAEVDASKAAEKTKRLEAALQPKGVPRGQSSYDDDDEEAAMARGFSGS